MLAVQDDKTRLETAGQHPAEIDGAVLNGKIEVQGRLLVSGKEVA